MDSVFNKLYDELVNYSIATEEEINLVCNINGSNVETLTDILYARTGYRNWSQFCESNNIENVFADYINSII